MAFVLSPNMNLPVPGVGTEAGPNYALDINSSLTLIDQHDHSPGKGVLITPSGININSALSFNSYPATNLSYLSLVAENSPSSVVQSVSVSGVSSINELFYTDSNGTQTQITKNGQVNAIAASIPGESYSAGTFIWTQTQSSLPTTPANFDIGSITIRPNTAGTTNGVMLSPPTSISSAYSIDLPLLPVSSAFLVLSNTGVMSASIPLSGGITASNISPTAGILGSQLSASAGILGTQLSASAGISPNQNTSSGFTAVGTPDTVTISSGAANFPVTGTTVSLTSPTSTRPAFIHVSGGFTIGSGGSGNLAIVNTNGSSVRTIANFPFALSSALGGPIEFSAGSLNCIDLTPTTPPGGFYQLWVTCSGTSVILTNFVMTVVQV